MADEPEEPSVAFVPIVEVGDSCGWGDRASPSAGLGELVAFSGMGDGAADSQQASWSARVDKTGNKRPKPIRKVWEYFVIIVIWRFLA